MTVRTTFRLGLATLLAMASLALSAPCAALDAAELEAQLQTALERLDAQEQELAAQRQMLLDMRKQLAQRAPESDADAGTVDIGSSTQSIGGMLALTDALTSRESAQATQVAAADAQQDDPTRDMLRDFSGAIPIPDSDAAFRIGGFVKTDLIHNFDPLAVQDRFIVGEIPPDNEPTPAGAKAQSQITVNQSRLNLDLRQATDEGILRAFVEGDFQGSDEAFRLRHAFGQWKSLLAGQTWSAFMDTAASPEEIDFEGLNGRVNVRQPQLRFSPQLTDLARRHEFVVSIENPDPQVADATGLSEVPDLVTSARFNLQDHIHYQLALLARQIRATWDLDPGVTKKAWGYGASLSGAIETPSWGEKDKILFQINGGKGIGRYINDLSTVGAFDGVISPTGDLELLDVYAGYVSGQHWWRGTLRSNLTFGFVQVDSPSFVDDGFYRRTYRASVNLLWSPTPRIDFGGEYLWGKRDNVGGSSGTASQVQMAAKYQF
jgi:DcaP outer membrane protein